jgi:hypothetical protein
VGHTCVGCWGEIVHLLLIDATMIYGVIKLGYAIDRINFTKIGKEKEIN